LNKTIDNLPESNETTFLQPFTVFVSLGQFAKNFKKNFENLTRISYDFFKQDNVAILYENTK
jgi:hypothetical protein